MFFGVQFSGSSSRSGPRDRCQETRVNRCFPSALVVHIQALQLAAEKMSQSWVVTAILGHFLQLDGFWVAPLVTVHDIGRLKKPDEKLVAGIGSQMCSCQSTEPMKPTRSVPVHRDPENLMVDDHCPIFHHWTGHQLSCSPCLDTPNCGGIWSDANCVFCLVVSTSPSTEPLL